MAGFSLTNTHNPACSQCGSLLVVTYLAPKALTGSSLTSSMFGWKVKMFWPDPALFDECVTASATFRKSSPPTNKIARNSSSNTRGDGDEDARPVANGEDGAEEEEEEKQLDESEGNEEDGGGEGHHNMESSGNNNSEAQLKPSKRGKKTSPGAFRLFTRFLRHCGDVTGGSSSSASVPLKSHHNDLFDANMSQLKSPWWCAGRRGSSYIGQRVVPCILSQCLFII